MSRNRRKAKGRREGGSFLALPHAVLDSPSYIALRPTAKALLNDLGRQYNGANNGDLCAAWSLMSKRGWRSKDTLFRALQELTERGLIEKTRQGGRNHCNLYALTWMAIDDCKGKLDYGPTRAPSGLWRKAEKICIPDDRATQVRQSG